MECCPLILDRRSIIVVALAVAVLIGFSVYTLGSYSAPPKAGTKVQPASTADIKNNTQQQTLISKSEITTKMSVYANRDKPGNYYSIQFPQNAIVEHGNNPGSLISKLPSVTATFSVDLEDIPDTSNVQLHMLTQVEPSLKSSLQHYIRVSSNQFTISGNRAWDLTYTWNNSTIPMESKKTFVEGSDNAAVITFSGPSQMFGKISNSLNPVMGSFRWLGQ
jgi:hypothetical protein